MVLSVHCTQEPDYVRMRPFLVCSITKPNIARYPTLFTQAGDQKIPFTNKLFIRVKIRQYEVTWRHITQYCSYVKQMSLILWKLGKASYLGNKFYFSDRNSQQNPLIILMSSVSPTLITTGKVKRCRTSFSWNRILVGKADRIRIRQEF